jgi:hypothetical protein
MEEVVALLVVWKSYGGGEEEEGEMGEEHEMLCYGLMQQRVLRKGREEVDDMYSM